MTDCKLQAGELLYLAERLGVERVCGVPNAFQTMSRAARTKTQEDIQQGLRQKKWVDMDFDGTIVVSKELTDFLSPFFNCERFAVWDTATQKVGQQSILYFVGANGSVAAKKNDLQYSFFSLPPAQVAAYMLQQLEWYPAEPLDQGSFTLPMREMQKLENLPSAQMDSGLRELLCKYGAQKALQALSSGLQGQANTYSLTLINLTATSDSVKTRFYLNAQAGSLAIDSATTETGYAGLRCSETDLKRLRQDIQTMLEPFCIERKE